MKLALAILMMVASVARADELADEESTATTIALGTTAAGAALVVTGYEVRSVPVIVVGAAAMVVGPSGGHLYAGAYGHALGMSTLRAAAALTSLVAIAVTFTSVADGSAADNDHHQAREVAGVAAAVYLAAAVYDIVDARQAVRREHLAVVPLATQGGAGLMVAGRF